MLTSSELRSRLVLCMYLCRWHAMQVLTEEQQGILVPSYVHFSVNMVDLLLFCIYWLSPALCSRRTSRLQVGFKHQLLPRGMRVRLSRLQVVLWLAIACVMFIMAYAGSARRARQLLRKQALVELRPAHTPPGACHICDESMHNRSQQLASSFANTP
jgi:hypothetical protein